MFSTFALLISFGLWKIAMLAILAVEFGIFFIAGWLVAHDERGFFDFVLNKKHLKIAMTIAAIVSIPWWNHIYDAKITKDMYAPITRSWAEHIAKDEPVVRINEKVEIRRYELLGWNPPKHFYVTLEDIVTHDVHQSVYVSKHCNAHYNLKQGEEYNVKITRYAWSNNPTKELMEFTDLYSTFCGSD